MLSSIPESIVRYITSSRPVDDYKDHKSFESLDESESIRPILNDTNKGYLESTQNQATSKYRVGTKNKKSLTKEVDESSQKLVDAESDEFAILNEKEKIKNPQTSILLIFYRIIVYGGPLYYILDLYSKSSTRKQKELQTLADQADAMKYGVGMTLEIAHLLTFLILAIPLALADRGVISHDFGIGVPVSFVGTIYLYIFLKKMF